MSLLPLSPLSLVYTPGIGTSTSTSHISVPASCSLGAVSEEAEDEAGDDDDVPLAHVCASSVARSTAPSISPAHAAVAQTAPIYGTAA